jgi:phosphoserine phosphatase RsbX
VETIKDSLIECGVARFILPGEGESGDLHLIRRNKTGILIAAIDGIGHGQVAAKAAKTATSVLEAGASKPIIPLVEQCHAALRLTRGVVLSIASIDFEHGLMTWLGVGNVQGLLMRASSKNGEGREMLLLRAGVVGAQLPPLQAAVLPIAHGDTLFFSTDGIRSDFVESLTAKENPQRAADRILEKYRSGNDDALLLAVRLMVTRA